MKRVELLSPAGDLEKLKIAYLYGADACYIGGKEFSLRANANNFSLEEIKQAVDYAHKLNKKLYVTTNIVFHNENLNGIIKYLKSLEDINVDAIILSDPLLIDIVKKYTPTLRIHISTQACTTNGETVNYFKEMGVERVVLAREVSQEDMKEIYDKTHMDLEVFLHGAMCTCYSGRCVLSNYFTNRDSNRGGCAQVCRFVFDLDKKRKTKYSIATKDLNLSSKIKDLIETGIMSLKIEGRMRSTYYVATVINSYRKLIDAYYNNNLTEDLLHHEQKILSRVANRESTTQYFDHQADYNDQYYIGREEVSNQDFLGIVLDYDKKTKYATVEQRNYFKPQQTINIFGPNNIDFDIKIDKIYDEDFNELDAARHPRQILKIKVDQELEKDSILRVKF